MRLRFFSLLLVPILAAIPSALAITDQAPASDRWVVATFDLAQPTLTHIDLTGTLEVHKYLLAGGTQTATQMSASYAGTGDAFATDTETMMKADLAASLAAAFPDAAISVQSATIDRSSLTAARIDDYTPPIHVTLAATIDRSRESVGVGTLSDAAVAAAFASGARVQTEPTLIADPGYRSTYTIHVPAAPAGLVFTDASQGTRSTDGHTVTSTVDNLAGTQNKLQITTLVLRDPSATAPQAEDIQNVVDIKFGAPAANVTTLAVSIDIAGEMRAIDPAARFPGVLPSTVILDYVNADGIRALYQAGAISDAQLKAADATLLAEAKDGLGKAFGPDVAPHGGLSRADLQLPAARPYDAEPPVRFTATADALYAIPGAHAADLDLALDIGATVKFDFALFSSHSPSSFVLHAPPGSEFTEARNGGLLAADHKSATFAVPADAASPSAGLSMRKIGAPEYTKEVATLNVTVDLADLQVTLGGAAKGDFGNLVVGVTITGALDVVSVDKLPDSVRAQVQSPNLELNYLSGNAVRLAYARGLISETDLASVEKKLMDETAAKLSTSMEGAVAVTGGFEKDSLASSASAATPIRFVAHSSFIKPLAGGAPTDTTKAVALKTIQKSFTLPRVQGLDTTYTVIMPKGLDVSSVTATGGSATSGTASDGRSQFVVTPSGESAIASVAIAVTPTFVLAKFWPVVLLAVLLVFLLIGTPIALVVARRNKKKKA